MRAIVVTFDRLPARLLACCGNEWMETPSFDQLAARSAVFERHFAELPGPAGPAHPWWTGRLEFFAGRAAEGNGPAAEETQAEMIASLIEAGVNCHLMTERSEGLPLAAFSSWEPVEAEDGLDIDHSATPIATLVQRGLQFVNESTGDAELLWLHSRGVPSPWLPPRLFAELYLNELEEDDAEEEWDEHTGEPLVQESEPAETEDETRKAFDASGILDELAGNPSLIEAILSDDPDDDFQSTARPTEQQELERLISRYIFAGYVSLLDHWLGRLVRGLEERSAGAASSEEASPETHLIVTAASGHVVGDRMSFVERQEEASELCDDLLQTPLLIHRVGATEFGTRCGTLVGPQNLAPTLHELFAVQPASPFPEAGLARTPESVESSPGAELLHLSPSGEIAIRNREWLLVLPDVSLLKCDSLEDHDELPFEAKLYALPDDLWQVNDVSSRRRDVVIELAEKLQTALQAAGRL